MFSLPYDFALTDGIQATGASIRVYGRVLRFPGEFAMHGEYVPFFYRMSDGLIGGAARQPFRLYLKACEHLLDMGRFVSECRRRRPDVVHFEWIPVPMIDSWFLDRIKQVCPIVLTVHDSTPFNGDPPSRLQLRETSKCWRKFDQLITHTCLGRETLLQLGVERNRINVIPHGILRERPGTNPLHRNASDRVNLLFFGQIKHYKGLDVFIEALSCLSEDTLRKIRVRICGKPFMDLAPLLEKIETAGLSGIIDVRADHIPDHEVDSLFTQSDIIVLPYQRIDASGVLSIALGRGLAVVASDIGGFSELLEDGETALLCPPNDVPAFARAIERLVWDDGLRSRIRANAQTLSTTAPSWNEIGALTVEAYRKSRSSITPGLERGEAAASV
jgi:glycosyltransferase involved in cell wall biosynthesis